MCSVSSLARQVNRQPNRRLRLRNQLQSRLWVFFADGSVKLYDSKNGDLIYDFNGKTKDLKLEPAGTGLKLSFRCDETQRFYTFEKALEGTDMELDIDRDWTDEGYHILMPLQD